METLKNIGTLFTNHNSITELPHKYLLYTSYQCLQKKNQNQVSLKKI